MEEQQPPLPIHTHLCLKIQPSRWEAKQIRGGLQAKRTEEMVLAARQAADADVQLAVRLDMTSCLLSWQPVHDIHSAIAGLRRPCLEHLVPNWQTSPVVFAEAMPQMYLACASADASADQADLSAPYLLQAKKAAAMLRKPRTTPWLPEYFSRRNGSR